MAITKIMHMKECKGSDKAKHLRNGIKYILNPKKTDGGWLIGGNCGTDPEEVFRSMMETKERFGKKEGRQGYHFVLSFKQGEVEPGQALNIVQEFAKDYLKDQYDMVCAVHTDTDHIHGHIIFNSIDRYEGRKYRYEKGDWEKYIQPITNKICKSYGLSYINFTHPEKEDNWKNRRDILRSIIDETIQKAKSLDEFIQILCEQGFKVRKGISEKHGVYYAIKMPGRKAIRTYSLGPAYNVEMIQKRIKLKGMPVPRSFNSTPKAARVQFHIYKYVKSGFSTYQIYFFRRIFNARKLYSAGQGDELSKWEIERNRKELRALQEQLLFLVKHNVKSQEDLEALKNALKEKDQGYANQLGEIGNLFQNRKNKNEKRMSDFGAYLLYRQLKEMLSEARLPENREAFMRKIKELESEYDLKNIEGDYKKYQGMREQVLEQKRKNRLDISMTKRIERRWNARMEENQDGRIRREPDRAVYKKEGDQR